MPKVRQNISDKRWAEGNLVSCVRHTVFDIQKICVSKERGDAYDVEEKPDWKCAGVGDGPGKQ